MVYFDIEMSYIDIMASDSYVRTQPISNRPGLLDVVYRGEGYRFLLETAHTDERRNGAAGKSREHSHHVYHVVLYTEGVNRFQLGGRETASEPGTLVLTGPGQSHDFGPLVRGRTSYHEMTFTFEHPSGPLMVPFSQLLSLYSGIDPGPMSMPRVLGPKPLNLLNGLFKELLRQIDQSQGESWFGVYRTILDMLSFIILELFVPVGTAAEPSAPAAVKAFIDRYYAGSIRLGDLARKAHFSEAHLCRMFKKEYGLSPIAYQQTLRIAAARNLITSTNYQCKDIAHKLGYADGYAFSKAFKKMTGVSPNHYRRGTEG
jgi:AraC family transcriptional regulator, L-rhamnose operon transcriptional activator RhaR